MRRVAFGFLFIILLGSALWCEGGEYPYRFFYVSSKLDNDGDVEKICSVVKSAAGAGFNGMVFSSPSLEKLNVEFSDYAKRLKEVAKVCNENNIEIVPMVFSLNSDDCTVFTDKNLAEGLPVKDAPFIVSNGTAVLVPDQSVHFTNGNFEDYVGNQIKLDQLQDIAVQVVFADKVVYKEGKTSLRFEKQEQNAGTKGYIAQEVRVKPYRSYKITFWVKTEGLKPATSFLPQVHGKESRILMELNPILQSDSDWQKMTFGFNSCDNSTVKIYLGLSNWVSGKLWVDDLVIEEVAPLNVLSRPGTPVVVRNNKTGTTYEKSYDYAPIVDNKMNFRFDHEEPLVKILHNSGIKEDDRLRVSFYQGIALHESQVTYCMSEPRMYEIWRSQARAIHEAFAPQKYFLNVTQVRAGGSCETCKERGISVAQILGDCITRQLNIVRELNPNAEVFIWSDMLDGSHNARDNYYLVDGDLTGSWNYIPKDLVIVCWHYKLRNESMHHFSNLGFKTLVCINADKGADEIRYWQQAMKNTPESGGAIYTSFENDYTKLASFGKFVYSKNANEEWLDVPLPEKNVPEETLDIATMQRAKGEQPQIMVNIRESADEGRIVSVSSSSDKDEKGEDTVSGPVQESNNEKQPSFDSTNTITVSSEQNRQVAISRIVNDSSDVQPNASVAVSPQKNAVGEQPQIAASSSNISEEGQIVFVSSSPTPYEGNMQTVVSALKNEVADKLRTEVVTLPTTTTQESGSKKHPSSPSCTPVKSSSSQQKVVVFSPAVKNVDAAESQASAGNNDNKTAEPGAPSLRTQAATMSSSPSNKSGGIGVIFGLVGGIDDEVMKGVKIAIKGVTFSDNAETDEDGFFEFSNLVAGDYTVIYEKDDCQTQRITINLEEGEVVDLGTVTMGTTKSYIYGYVRDSVKGNPIGTATIKLKGLKTKSKNTSFSDTDGFFKFADLGEDTYLLIARKRGFKRINRTVRLSKGEERVFELEMRIRMKKESAPSKVTIESSKGKVLEEE